MQCFALCMPPVSGALLQAQIKCVADAAVAKILQWCQMMSAALRKMSKLKINLSSINISSFIILNEIKAYAVQCIHYSGYYEWIVVQLNIQICDFTCFSVHNTLQTSEHSERENFLIQKMTISDAENRRNQHIVFARINFLSRQYSVIICWHCNDEIENLHEKMTDVHQNPDISDELFSVLALSTVP